MAEEEKITLTLESQSENENITESVKTEDKFKQFDYESLTSEEKKMVDDFASQININQTTDILQYGSAAQNKVADFSESTLKKITASDIGDVGEELTKLVRSINDFDKNEAKGLKKLFFSAKDKIEDIKVKYDSASENIERVVKALEGHQVLLMKDISLLDQLYDKNLTNVKELSMYIIAGYKALDRIKTIDLPAVIKKADESNLPEDAQKVKDMNDAIVRFEKRIHDLELTRVVSIQMAPQIRLVQNNDTTMIEKIQSTLVNTIPLWKSQMIIAMGIEDSKQALKAQNEVSELTNKMLLKNAENLKTTTIGTARESERGIVDIETLTKTNKSLIETLDEVKKIQVEGKEQRAKALVELRRIEAELQEKLKDIAE